MKPRKKTVLFDAVRPLPLLVGLLLTGFAAAQTSPPPAKGPVEVIKETTYAITKVLENDDLPELTQQNKVIEVVDERVDFETVCKLVLATNYKKFSGDQRKQFVQEFRRHLLFTYWNNASSLDFEKIVITSDRKEKRRDWTVKTLVHHNGDSTRIDYRLRLRGADEKNSGEWKIIDILIEGVSLVSNFRSQFKSLVSNQGPEGLLKTLRKKNDKEEKAMKAKDKEQAK